MRRLLKQIGFSEAEIECRQSDIARLTQILGLEFGAMEHAAESLQANFDLSYESVKALLKILVTVILDDLRDMESSEKRVFQTAIPMPNAVSGTINALSGIYRLTASEYLLVYLSGVLFDSYQLICTSGQSTCKRCGLNLTREKLYTNPFYPHPHGVVSCFAYCDELAKTGEALALQHGLDHKHLAEIKGLGYEEQRFFLSQQLMHFLHDMTGREEEAVQEALKKFNDGQLQINILLNKINSLVARTPEVYVTFNEISLLNLFNLVCLPDHCETGRRILQWFIRELKQRIKNPECQPVLESPLRIGCMHLPFTNPRIDRIFRKQSSAVIVSSLYTSTQGKCNPENEVDRCLMGFFSHSVMRTVHEKAKGVDHLIESFQLDAFLFGQFENDRALGGDQLMIMEKTQHRNQIHYLPISNWQKVDASMNLRIESLVAMINERKV